MGEPSVNILDTTLREGELNLSVYYTPQMLRSIGLALAELGTPRIEFSIVYPQRGGDIQDLKAVISDVHDGYANVTTIAQCRAYLEDIDIAQDIEAKGCGVYIAVSEEHMMNKLSGMSVEEVINRFAESLDILKEYGFNYRRAVLEDSSRYFSHDRTEEDTLDRFRYIVNALDQSSATTISIPDTAGLLDESQALRMFEFASEVTDKELAAHFHNDYGNALANTKTVVQKGFAKEAHVSIYGLGAGAGIADHYELSANLIDNLMMDTGENRTYLKRLYDTFQEVTKIPIPWNHPLSNFSRTEKAGTHQAQQLKSPKGYVPSKKLEHDFNNKIFFEAGKLMSRHLVNKFLEDYKVDEETARQIADVIGSRSTLINRKLFSGEIKNIIKEVAGVNIPIIKISQYIGPDKVFYLLKVRPQVTTEITEKIEQLEGVERVLETYGIYDIIVETNIDREIRKRIEKMLDNDLIEISPLIIG